MISVVYINTHIFWYFSEVYVNIFTHLGWAMIKEALGAHQWQPPETVPVRREEQLQCLGGTVPLGGRC